MYIDTLFPALIASLVAASAREWRAGRRPFWSWCAAGLFLCSWPPAALLFTFLLEIQTPPQEPRLSPGESPQAIVVLAAETREVQPPRPAVILGPRTFLRCQCAAELSRTHPALPVLVTGGRSGSAVTADLMAEAVAARASPATLWLEREAQSTAGNAAFCRRLLAEHSIRRVLLVTDAVHMPRAAAAFRKQGLEVIPVACGFRARRQDFRWNMLLPSPGAVLDVEYVVHELAASAWYWWRDWL